MTVMYLGIGYDVAMPNTEQSDYFKKKQAKESDEVLCALSADGDRLAEETLITRYHRLVRAISRPYFLAGGDSDDLLQEGMIGLMTAVREFDCSKEASFRTFAKKNSEKVEKRMRLCKELAKKNAKNYNF